MWRAAQSYADVWQAKMSLKVVGYCSITAACATLPMRSYPMVKVILMPSTSSNKYQQKSATTEFPSLEISLDLTREKVASQQGQINALDTKANFVLTAATILLGTGLTAQIAITTESISILGQHISRALPLAILVAAYLLVVISAYQAYRIRSYDNAPEPQKLVDEYLKESGEITKEDALRAMAIAFANNRKEIKFKVRWTRWALNALVAESAVLMVVLILEAVQ